MNLFRTFLFIAFVLCLSDYAFSQEALLYGVGRESCDENDGASGSALYSINPNTGSMVLIGSIGFDGVTALAVLDDGRLLGTARQGNDESILIEINPSTGQGTLIGVIGNRNNPGECGRVPGLTYDSSTGTLYGIGFRCGAGLTRVLAAINPNTAEFSPIGEVGFGGGGNGLAVRGDGTLFASGWQGTTFSLYTLNPNTGASTLVGTMDTSAVAVGGLGVNGLAFTPFSQQLFASSTNGDVGVDSYLLAVDESAPPSFDVVAETFGCFDGIVFAEFVATSVPALSTWGFVALILVIGAAALFYIRKRKLLGI